MAQGLASILRMWGHNVRTAHDGAAALEVATQFAPEVVLLDLSLPRVDGLEVARRLRQAPEHTPTLMVSMSGFGQEDTRRHSGEAGFHHHLTKPFDMGALRAMLDDCMRSKSTVCHSRKRITFPQAGNRTSENANHRPPPVVTAAGGGRCHFCNGGASALRTADAMTSDELPFAM